jgi:hypothetical protein
MAEEYAALVGSDSSRDILFDGARVVFDRANRPGLSYDRSQSRLFQQQEWSGEMPRDPATKQTSYEYERQAGGKGRERFVCPAAGDELRRYVGAGERLEIGTARIQAPVGSEAGRIPFCCGV